jgi:hypothetical protein
MEPSQMDLLGKETCDRREHTALAKPNQMRKIILPVVFVTRDACNKGVFGRDEIFVSQSFNFLTHFCDDLCDGFGGKGFESLVSLLWEQFNRKYYNLNLESLFVNILSWKLII